MKVKLDINARGAAFCSPSHMENNRSDATDEIVRLLREAAKRLAEDQEIVTHGGRMMLYDINGNRCGQLDIDHGD